MCSLPYRVVKNFSASASEPPRVTTDPQAAKKLNFPLPDVFGLGVMISTSGTRLIEPAAMEALRRTLLPLALLVTPNVDEASALVGKQIRTPDEMEEAARQIHRCGPRHVLIKGGHLQGEYARDILFDGGEFLRLQSLRVATQNTHGTGCVLSASIAGYLALGSSIREAVALGKEFVTSAINHALQIGHGRGPCDPLSLGG